MVWSDVRGRGLGGLEIVCESFDGSAGIRWLYGRSALYLMNSKILTLVVSMLRGRISGRDIACTVDSSSAALQTTNTICPLLSISKASDFVNGSIGDPAMTTTSTLPPLRAFLALRVLRNDRLF